LPYYTKIFDVVYLLKSLISATEYFAIIALKGGNYMTEKEILAAEREATRAAMRWYGWGSPIGLSIFLLALVLIAAIVKTVFFG
jgi:hypothetical protein